jgi:TMEM175 potassium channel family protein
MKKTSHDKVITPERLAFFSDAVIAIAITLLVLDIKVPKADTIPALISALLGQWTNYLSFFISFSMTGVAWINHHRMFTYIRRTNNTLLVLNTLFLMWVALIPFATGLMAEYLAKPGAPVGAFVYGMTLTIVGVFFNLIWIYLSHKPVLLEAKVDMHEIMLMKKQYSIGFIFYVLATALSLVNADISVGLYVLLIIYSALSFKD